MWRFVEVALCAIERMIEIKYSKKTTMTHNEIDTGLKLLEYKEQNIINGKVYEIV